MMTSNGNISALLALYAGNSPVPGEFPAQRLVTRSFDVFFDLHLNKWLNKQSRPCHSWRHRAHYDVTVMYMYIRDATVCYHCSCTCPNTCICLAIGRCIVDNQIKLVIFHVSDNDASYLLKIWLRHSKWQMKYREISWLFNCYVQSHQQCA